MIKRSFLAICLTLLLLSSLLPAATPAQARQHIRHIHNTMLFGRGVLHG